MHYPIWTDMATCSDKALVSDWQTYISALFLHELGHLHIARAGLVHRRTQLNTLAIVETAPTCGEACAAARSAISHRTEQAIDDLVEEIEQAHRDYDRRTEHGRRQGAEF
jgi:predicted secreted Zn-dependent protease